MEMEALQRHLQNKHRVDTETENQLRLGRKREARASGKEKQRKTETQVPDKATCENRHSWIRRNLTCLLQKCRNFWKQQKQPKRSNGTKQKRQVKMVPATAFQGFLFGYAPDACGGAWKTYVGIERRRM